MSVCTNFDVLEHIEEDEKFVKEIHRIVKPGGFVLVTVPAYMFLWSEFDEVLGHVRRYSRTELVRKFRKSGFNVIRASYFNAILTPAFILARAIQSRKKTNITLEDSVIHLPPVFNRFLSLLMSLEALIIRNISLPFGTSIILLAKVPDR